MRVPERPRYLLVKAAVKQELERHGQCSPPVEVERLVARMAKIILFDHDTCDGWTSYQDGKYTVHLNRRFASDGRGRWTLAHELGHIVLGHFRDFPTHMLHKREEGVLEREADIFARELLMSAEWVRTYVHPPCDARALGHYKEMFGVSWEALKLRLDELGIQPKETSTRYLEGSESSPGVSSPV